MPNEQIQVLDRGFVRLVDHMGDDSSIVQMARVSYGAGTKTKRDDRGLIRYLVRMRHTSPLEGVVFKFHVKAPLFVFRQWHRHRTLSINEISARYSELPEECYVPEQQNVRAQDKTNRQGRGAQLSSTVVDDFIGYTRGRVSNEFQAYKSHLEAGVARELARINLPLNTYSEMYCVQNLHNLFHFLKLRMDSHAQWEIRQYAEALFELIKPVVPIACEAFEDYVLNSNTFSRQETEWLIETLSEFSATWLCGKLTRLNSTKRELKEFKDKLGL